MEREHLSRKAKKRLRSCRGESFAEVLAATLVITMGLTMLAGAIASSANVNRAAERTVSLLTGDSQEVDGSATVNGVYSVSVREAGGLYYYEKIAE